MFSFSTKKIENFLLFYKCNAISLYFLEINEQTVNLSAFVECQHVVQHFTGLLVQWYTFNKNFDFCSQHQVLAQLLIVEKIYQSLQSKKVWMFDLHAITFIFSDISYYRSPFNTFNHSTFYLVLWNVTRWHYGKKLCEWWNETFFTAAVYEGEFLPWLEMCVRVLVQIK